MKREFLQNLKVQGQVLPKEIVDAIMAENGRDIERVKSGYTDYEGLKQKLTELENREHDWENLQKDLTDWQEKYQAAETAHGQQLDQVKFDNCLHNAISAAKGRNVKAISALLDLDALRECEDRNAAIEDALSALKAENGYLFMEETLPPFYAEGTGKQIAADTRGPATLAGALREKFERKI